MDIRGDPKPGPSRVQKKTTKNTNKMPNIKEMSKDEIQAALIKKRQCDADALKIVERLMENPVPAPWFVYSIRFINQCHLDDVFEERALIKQCGYPICLGVLPNAPKKQYMISTKVNKIYDITERKKFCSDKCFKAAIFIREQMLTSPLWLRDKEDIPDFKLLPWTTKGVPGMEINFGVTENDIEPPPFTSVADFTKRSMEEAPNSFDEMEKQSYLEEEATTPAKLSKLIQKSNEKHGSDSRINRKVIENHFTEMVSEDEQFKYSKHQLKLINLSDKSQAKKLSEQISIQSLKERLENRRKAMAKQQEKRESGGASREVAKITDKLQTLDIAKSLDINSPNEKPIVKCEPTCSAAKSAETVSEVRKCLPETEEIPAQTINLEETIKPNESEISVATKPVITRKSAIIEKIKYEQPPESNPLKSVTPDLSTTGIAINYVEKCLFEWFTIDSLIFLYGRDRVKADVATHSCVIQEKLSDVLKESSHNLYENEAYIKLCKKIDMLELEEERYEKTVINKNLKPLPDYRMLRAENKRLIVKVRSFFNGSMEFEDPGYSDSETSGEEDSEVESDNEDLTVLPAVDKNSQTSLRRQIVFNCLSKTIPGLLQTFGLTSHDMTTEIRQFISTFYLTAKNIIFKPIHLNLLGILVLRLLGEKNQGLFKLMEEPTAIKYSGILLGIYKLPGDYLESLVTRITNIESIVDNHCNINK